MLVLLSTAPARAEVWGIKSKDPNSEPPVTLFHFDEDGSGLVGVGYIKLSGVNIDVDALAIDVGGGMYAFKVSSAGTNSQLLSIDPSSAVATLVGPSLSNRDIRGAVFAGDGRFLTLDANQNALLEIDPTTGNIVGSPIGLMLGGASYNIGDVTDIAQKLDGGFVIGGDNRFYSLNVATGEMVLLHTDNANGSDGRVTAHAGLAFSTDAPNTDTLFAYDVIWDDDIWTYQTDAAYARSLLHGNIFSGYNAGRGDLATTPTPEPATMLLLTAAAPIILRLRRRRK